jgi:hypothetical protein
MVIFITCFMAFALTKNSTCAMVKIGEILNKEGKMNLHLIGVLVAWLLGCVLSIPGVLRYLSWKNRIVVMFYGYVCSVIVYGAARGLIELLVGKTSPEILGANAFDVLNLLKFLTATVAALLATKAIMHSNNRSLV